MRPKLLHSLHTFSIIWGGSNYSCCPCGDAMHLLRCPSNGCAMDCWRSHVSTPTLLETHVHKTVFWTVRNYDDHCTVVVAICGQSQNVPKMVLIIAWACDWFSIAACHLSPGCGCRQEPGQTAGRARDTAYTYLVWAA